MKKIIVIFIILIIFVLSLMGIYLYKAKTRNAVEKFIENNIMINVLIAGSNIYNENKHKFYAIISIHPQTKKIGLIFIPPNFKVRLDERYEKYQRIEDVDFNDFKNLSASLYRDLKLKIPFYAVLYSPDVEKLVDLLEGIDLYVLDQASGIHGVKYGLNYFDGVKTVQYINSAEENSIFIKYDRIQDILFTIYSNKNRYKKYINMEFVSEAIRTIKTNFLAQEIVTLSGLLYDEKSDLMSTILPGSFSEDGFYYMDDISRKIFEAEILKNLVYNQIEKQPVKVKILNGTDIAGLAKRTRSLFVREGLNVIEFGTSPYPPQDETVIICQKGDYRPAARVAELLSVNKIFHIIDNTQINNVLLIIGKDMAR